MSSTTYRPDIDGLRALAVAPVILFHSKLGCPGGFVGVDIFFVISGYLISSIILKEIDAGTFSLVTFWERRVRRILPALTIVVLATFLAGACIYLPDDFLVLGKSIIAQAALCSNLFFYLQPNGYFDASPDIHPLLHTWSLAVEEQFYLLFPFLLLFLSKRSGLSVTKSLAALLMLSLVWSIFSTPYFPRASFYLMPARAWELLLGALLANCRSQLPTGRIGSEILGLIGLVLIGLSICLYNESTLFPGLAAVPPCLGAALIIYSSETRLSLVGRLLAMKPAVLVGLISYSLYLWHWPVLVFSQYLLGHQRWPVRVSLLIPVLVLAILTWWFVETPFRKRTWLPSRSRLFRFAGLSTVVPVCLGVALLVTNGLPQRFSPEALAYANGKHDHSFRRGTTLEEAKAGLFVELANANAHQPVELLIWGDSHAMGMTQVFDDLCRKQRIRGVQATQHGAPPVLSQSNIDLSDEPETFAECVLQYIVRHKIKRVFVTAHWKFYAKSEIFLQAMTETIRQLQKTGAQVYVVKDVPDHGFDVPRVSALTETWGGNVEALGVSLDRHQQMNRDLSATFDQIASCGATVLDPAHCFSSGECWLRAVKGGHALYTDGNHLSVAGARLLTPLFEPLVANQP